MATYEEKWQKFIENYLSMPTVPLITFLAVGHQMDT
jgi:hypothetical protein